MVNIRPFKAYHYDQAKVDISKVIFPPYELRNREFMDTFLKISDHNVIRIMLGDERLENSERYQYSAELLNAWIKDGHLKKYAKPCIYVYSQEFEADGRKMERTGFISLVELEELGKNIAPHEFTLHDQIINMKKLLEETRTNLGLVFSIYSDSGKKIESMLEKIKLLKPDIDTFTDYEGVRHRVWAVSDQKVIGAITKEMKNKKLLIADGHHRYKISYEYSREHPDDDMAKHLSMMMVNMENKGIAILPTHRLVGGIKNFDSEKFLSRLKDNFEIEIFEFEAAKKEEGLMKMLKKISSRDWRSFGMYLGGRKYYILTLKNEKAMDEAKDHSKPWKRFGINVLHTLIIKDMLGIDTLKNNRQCNVEYVKDIHDFASECVRKVEEGEFQAAFFTRSTNINEIKAIAESGEMMPQKSTCFYPKVYSGLIIYKFENGEKNF